MYEAVTDILLEKALSAFVQHAVIHREYEKKACTFPCMSSRNVRVTPKPPSPKSCSQFIVIWEWHAGRRMNKAHSLVTQSNEGQHSFSGSPSSFSAALREKRTTEVKIN